MKHFFSAIVIILLQSQIAFSQTGCGQVLATENWLKQHPEHRAAYEQAISPANSSSGNSGPESSVSNYTIPMVFHILHMGGPENISDAQVIDEVAILNRDYNKRNADTILVVPTFTPIIGDVKISFSLATIDPDGNCTNGIIRHYTNKTDWDAFNFDWFNYTWPRNKYLNIYVVRTINMPAYAYAFLPTVPVDDSADVVISLHNMIGSIGTSNLSNSRVITHEVAHWLNVMHIWGSSNSPGVACGDDGVSDTPVTKGFTVCSIANAAVCNPAIQENPQNYMDYADCKIMFTIGQAARMITCLTGPGNSRNNVSSAGNLLATGVTTPGVNCRPRIEIVALPSRTMCVGRPIALNSYSCNAATTSYSWTANNGALLQNATSANATVTLTTPGTCTVTCTGSGPGGATTVSLVLTAVSNSAHVLANYSESFETNALPPNWQIISNTTPNSFWAPAANAASHGTVSMFVNGEDASGASEEILETPAYDFLNNPGATYSFKLAYAQKSNTHKDVIKLQGSKNCGGTWTDIYTFNPITLAQASGGILSTPFVPASYEWKFYEISNYPGFNSFKNENNVKFRFYFREDSAGFGNRLYLDEINFTTPLGINTIKRDLAFRCGPNPTNGSLSLSFTLNDPKPVKITISDLAGKELVSEEKNYMSGGDKTLQLDCLNGFSDGVYILQLNAGGARLTEKIIVARN